MDDVRVILGGADVARTHFDQICDLYDLVFADAPFVWSNDESANHRKNLRKLIEDPSFAISVATGKNSTQRLIGFAYGVALGADTRWWSGLPAKEEVDFYSEWTGRTFALIDLAVHEAFRGRGYGKAVLASLLGSRNEERATLCVQPTARETQDIYLHLGWQHVGRKAGHPGSISPHWEVYAINL